MVAEVALFAWGRGLVERLGARGLALVAATAGLLRWGITAETVALPALVLAQALHAATFGAMHLATMRVMQHAIPHAVAGTAQTMFAAGIGAMSMVATLAAGQGYGAFGPAVFWGMAGMCGVAMVALRRLPGETRGPVLMHDPAPRCARAPVRRSCAPAEPRPRSLRCRPWLHPHFVHIRTEAFHEAQDCDHPRRDHGAGGGRAGRRRRSRPRPLRPVFGAALSPYLSRFALPALGAAAVKNGRIIAAGWSAPGGPTRRSRSPWQTASISVPAPRP